MAYHMNEAQILEEYEVVKASVKDARKFGIIYDRYFEGIFNFVYRRTDDEDLASDLTSQSFLMALQNIKRYEYRGLPISAWLYRIASNEVNKYYRQSKRRQVFSLEENMVAKILEVEEEEEDAERLEELIVIMREMSTQDVSILELRFFEEKNFKEIAYILEISESGAKMRTYRALERLKKVYNSNRRKDD